MRVIPVIDINQGQVVHAVAGQRDLYRPVRSCLCPDSDPVSIVQAFLDLFSFDPIYIADLDAISGRRPNDESLQKLLGNFPRLTFWLDRGINNTAELLNTMHPRIQHVLGSETGLNPNLLRELLVLSPQPILSLDFRKGQLLGNEGLLLQPELWPENIILMNLDRVGTASGVDKHLLAQILKTTKHSHVYIGGGIRNIADVQQLEACGIKGILIATALHTGLITSSDLRTMANIK